MVSFHVRGLVAPGALSLTQTLHWPHSPRFLQDTPRNCSRSIETPWSRATVRRFAPEATSTCWNSLTNVTVGIGPEAAGRIADPVPRRNTAPVLWELHGSGIPVHGGPRARRRLRPSGARRPRRLRGGPSELA